MYTKFNLFFTRKFPIRSSSCWSVVFEKRKIAKCGAVLAPPTFLRIQYRFSLRLLIFSSFIRVPTVPEVETARLLAERECAFGRDADFNASALHRTHRENVDFKLNYISLRWIYAIFPLFSLTFHIFQVADGWKRGWANSGCRKTNNPRRKTARTRQKARFPWKINTQPLVFRARRRSSIGGDILNAFMNSQNVETMSPVEPRPARPRRAVQMRPAVVQQIVPAVPRKKPVRYSVSSTELLI